MPQVVVPAGKHFVCIHAQENVFSEQGKVELPSLSAKDHRFNLPVGIFQESDSSVGIFQELLITKIEGIEVSVAAPNEIALAIGVSQHAFERAGKLWGRMRATIKNTKTIYGEEVVEFYDFLEEVQTSIVFSYKAVESLCNALIPDDYIYEEKDGKGIVHLYGKDQIERWIATSTKVTEILPALLECPKPNSQPFWSDFKVLERLRNDIVHSKSKSSAMTLADLFSENVTKYLKSSIALIQFFHDHAEDRRIFPIVFGGKMVVPIARVNDASEYLHDVDRG